MDQVRSYCMAWLAQQGLTVIDQASDGTEKRYPVWGQHMILHPTQGSLVAVSGKLSGAVVFEFLFYPAGTDSVVTVQGYAAGVGPFFSGKEYEFSSSALTVAGAPRKRGHGLLERFEKDLAQASAQAYPQFAPTPGQPALSYPPAAPVPSQYPPSSAQPTSPYYFPPGSQPPAVSPVPPQSVAPPPPASVSAGAPSAPRYSPPVVPYYSPPGQPIPVPTPLTSQSAEPTAATPAVSSPVASSAPAAPPSAFVQVPMCVSCGRPTTFISQYGRFYCYPCNRYV